MNDMKEFPEELLENFMMEIGEHSEIIEEYLLEMEISKGLDGIDGLFRAGQSIKGAA